ncbi:hypothetical protein [Caulobacter sp. 17J80-11]|uniref:hypothetical protein n=1 Tax=Caulobacter sp. 17J80-11 TaxID=2763502 RepID=UPI001653EBB0|nr:hypothetical protein [Caulobacter sp. 17J80-11]MBC6981307.1 hypothetical protein [Caulobacter sp. 17J80-11]
MRAHIQRLTPIVAVLALAAPALAGCESMGDIATGLAAAADDMNGVTYYDQSYSDDHSNENCPYTVEYGMASNQTYIRFHNVGPTEQTYTISYSTGATRTAYAVAGEYSDITWMPGAAQPTSQHIEC